MCDTCNAWVASRAKPGWKPRHLNTTIKRFDQIQKAKRR